ncbi:MAG: glutamine amidotransferase-related protein [Bacteroidia bacterium]
MRVLFIDNLDSFTFNVVHCLVVAGAEVEVLRNEGEDWPELAEKMADCDAWAVGPGPGRPPRLPPFDAGYHPMDGQEATAGYLPWTTSHRPSLWLAN